MCWHQQHSRLRLDWRQNYCRPFGWASVYGFAANGVQALFPAAVGELSTDPTRVGTKVGMILAVVSIPCFTGPPIGEQLAAINHGNYLYA